MKKVSKQIIQEALSDILDVPSNVVAGVKNVASSGYGAYNSGKVSNQLKRTADRIGKEWKKTADTIKKPIEKMSASGNPEVKQKALSAINNVQSIEKDVSTIMKKMASVADPTLRGQSEKGGALLNPFDDPSDFEDREITTAYGNKQIETPIQRWVKQMGMGADTKKIGVHEWAKINKAWLEMRTAGINPFDMTPMEAEKFLYYERLRNKAIEGGQGDPYAGWNDHWDYVFGKNKANQMRQKLANHYGIPVSELRDFFGVPGSNPESTTTSTPTTSSAPTTQGPATAREQRKAFRAELGAFPDLPEKIERAILKLMREQGVEKAREAFDRYKAMHAGVQARTAPAATSAQPATVSPPTPTNSSAAPIAPPTTQTPPPSISHSEKAAVQSLQPKPQNPVLPKSPPESSLSHSEKKAVQNLQPNNIDQNRNAVKINPIQKVSGQPSVKVNQIKQIGDVPQSQSLPPVKQKPIAAYAPKLTDFFSDKLPVPPEEQQKPPMLDKGSEIQVGDASNPGFGPPPETKKKKPAKKRSPSSRPKKKTS